MPCGLRGYELDGRKKLIVYSRDSETGKITLIEQYEALSAVKADEDTNIEVKITNEKSPDYFNLHIEKFISKINEVTQTQTEPIVKVDENGKVTYEKSSEALEVTYGDRIIYTMRVYNDGFQDGFAKEITDKIPAGLEFVEDSSINIANGWKLSSDNTEVTTNILDIILAFNFTDMETPEYRDVQMVSFIS